jgi:hypothetical protein
VRTVPPEIRDYLNAERLGLSLQEYLAMPIDDADGQLACLRGREIAETTENGGERQ